MIQCRTDQKYYATEADFPDYGDWFPISVDGINVTLGGDSDATKLPTTDTVTTGWKALSTDGTLYGFNGTSWAQIGG